MVVLAVIGLLVLAFIVAVFFSARNLTVPQLLLWFALFLTTLGFLYISSIVMAAHGKWKSAVAQLQQQIESAQQQKEELTRGNKSVRAVAHQLSLEVVGAGQVWNNMLVENIDPNGIVLNARFWGMDRCVGGAAEGGALEPVPAETPPAEPAATAPAEGETAAAPAEGAAPGTETTPPSSGAAEGGAAA